VSAAGTPAGSARRRALRVRLAAVLAAAGLAVQATTLLSPSYKAFLAFAGIGAVLTLAGAALFVTALRRGPAAGEGREP